jgi:hypothetical protein
MHAAGKPQGRNHGNDRSAIHDLWPFRQAAANSNKFEPRLPRLPIDNGIPQQ